jgi:hypothetical protein
MVNLIAQSSRQRGVDVVADSAHCNDTLTRGLAKHVCVLGAISP